MTYLIIAAAAIVCGLVVYIIADKRKLKKPILWGVGGAVITALTLGIVKFAKKKKEEKRNGY